MIKGLGLTGIVFGIVGSLAGWYGTRDTRDLYYFEYMGELSVLSREDRRFGLDRYHIRIGERGKIESGEILSDLNVSIFLDPDNGLVNRDYRIYDWEKLAEINVDD